MTKPVVGIIMGSQSDLKIMKEAAEVLEELNISFESIHNRISKKQVAYSGAWGYNVILQLSNPSFKLKQPGRDEQDKEKGTNLGNNLNKSCKERQN